jgi:polygalacturonase
MNIFLLAFAGAVSILQFGAVPNSNTNAAALANSQAIMSALYAANKSDDREALVPAGLSFYIFNSTLYNLYNVTLRIDGELLLSNNLSAWPNASGFGGCEGALQFEDTNYLRLTGSGLVDGQGYDWWWYVILLGADIRPHLVVCYRCVNLLIDSLHFKNSPQ